MGSDYWKRIGGRYSRRSVLRGGTLAAAGLAGAALLGCGGGDDDPPGTGGSPGGGSATGTATSDAGGAAQRGGTLNVSFLRWTEPPRPGRNGHTAVDYFNATHNRLIYQDAHTFELIPELSESWEQVDETTLILKLRQGSQFHDTAPIEGRFFNAEDVVASMENNAGHLDTPDQSVLYPRRYVYDTYDNVDVIDEYTAQINFNRPNSSFLATQADILLYTIAREQVDIGWADPLKIRGTGPFMMQSIQGDHDRAQYIRNPNYWEEQAGGALPLMDEINHFNIADRSTWLGQFISQDTDFFTNPSSPERESIRRTFSDAVYTKYKVSKYFPLLLNLNRGPLGDVRVRKALHLAMERAPLNDAWFGNEDGDWWYQGFLNNSYPQALSAEDAMKMPGNNPDTKEQDIAEAKRLMEAAGYPDGALTFVSPVTIAAGRTYEYLVRINDQFQKIWPAMSIETPVYDVGVYTQQLLAGEWDVRMVGGQSSPDPLADLYFYYHSGGTPGANYAAPAVGYHNQEVNDLIEAGLAEFTPEGRQDHITRIEQLLEEDAPNAPIAQFHEGVFHTPRVNGFVEAVGPALAEAQHSLGQVAKNVWLST